MPPFIRPMPGQQQGQLPGQLPGANTQFPLNPAAGGPAPGGPVMQPLAAAGFPPAGHTPQVPGVDPIPAPVQAPPAVPPQLGGANPAPGSFPHEHIDPRTQLANTMTKAVDPREAALFSARTQLGTARDQWQANRPSPTAPAQEWLDWQAAQPRMNQFFNGQDYRPVRNPNGGGFVR